VSIGVAARMLRRFPALEAPGAWFWALLLAGAAARVWLVVGTAGTLDVDVWEAHASEINQKGLIHYYHGGRYRFNHPPLMGEIFSRLSQLSVRSGVPFAVFLRAPFAILDLGTLLLLLKLLAGDSRRFLLSAGYWLLPPAMVFSAYHGNTDSGLAFFLVAAVILVGSERPLLAGAVLGAALWVKLPAVLALPALFFGFPGWAARFRFGAAVALVGISTYLPALWRDPAVVVESVFLYPGLQIRSLGGVQIWGPQLFYPEPAVLRANTWICLLPVAGIAWARRRDRSPLQIAGNVGAGYVVFHGLTNFWAWQYLAWALPLWLVAGGRFALPMAIATTAYVCGLYVWLTGSLVLDGSWNFLGQPQWPAWLLWARDGAQALFLATAVFIVARDGRRVFRDRIFRDRIFRDRIFRDVASRWRRPTRSGEDPPDARG